jgi:RNA-directed DNA polymerase
MVQTNFPGTERRKAEGTVSKENVRELQRELYRAAKRRGQRKFHALYSRICEERVLREAWSRVRSKRGAAGVDEETLGQIERTGVERMLQELQEQLQEGTYHPHPVRRVYIPKPDGRKRPLGIPTVRDRVVQMAAKIVMEPVFEADFLPSSYGFRPKRSLVEALERLRVLAPQGYEWVLEVDIEKYFDTINQEQLMRLVEYRISDRRVLKLVRKWLKAGVLEGEGRVQETLLGTPQGGVLSPLLANIYLHELDKVWENSCQGIGILVRYADDFVIACKSEAAAKEALKRVQDVMDWLKLKLHPMKTRIVHLRQKGIDFLGCHLRMGESRRFKGRWYLYRWPNQKAMIKARERIRQIIHRWQSQREELLKRLSEFLRGWGIAFRNGNATQKFCAIDGYVWQRLMMWEHRRRGWNQRRFMHRFNDAWYRKLPLYHLPGTIRYPVAHAAR